MKNKIKALSLIFFMIFLITACSQQGQKNSDSLKKKNETDVKTSETVDIKLSTSFAPNSIPLFYMMEKDLLGENINLEVSIHKTRQEVTAMLMKNNIDMAMLSVQEAAKLYNKDIPVKLINTNYGATFFLMANNEIQSIEHIKGKTIWTSEKGGPVEFVLSAVLKNNGINPNEDVKLKFMNLKELAQLVVNDLKDIEVFTLREPFVSQVNYNKKDGINIVSNLDKEWKKIYGNRVPFAGVVSRTDFLSKHPEVVSIFNEKYNEAIEWVKENPKEAAKLGTKYLKGMPEKVIEASLNNMNLELVDETKVETELKAYYEQWLKFNPEMIGNKLPDDSFYSELKN